MAEVNLMVALTNRRLLMKLQSDLSGKESLTSFEGAGWAWVGGKGNFKVFNTFGIGTSRIEDIGDNVYRFYHREVLYYCDPKTGEILDTWDNPITGKKVEVLHILNDPVNRVYRLKGG